MEDFELPIEAKTLINNLATYSNIEINWIPVVDFHAPNGVAEDLWKAGRAQRKACLDKGESIAVACLYGAGRSGMMAAAVCAEMGVEAKQAVRFVRRHFDEAVGSREQERWVESGTYLT
jgi:protein-tyrosine phosphatase